MWLEASLNEVTPTGVPDRASCVLCALLPFPESWLPPALEEAGAGIGAEMSKMLVKLER